MPVWSGLVFKAEINSITVPYEGIIIALISAIKTKPDHTDTVLKCVGIRLIAANCVEK